MVDVCGLNDLGFEGRNWTFKKKVAGGSYCRVRLDCGLATADWCNKFSHAKVQHLAVAASDHGPILLEWRPAVHRRRQGKRFRYEQIWETHLEFSGTLAESWQREGEAKSLSELQEKLKGVSRHLSIWERATFGQVQYELRNLNKRLEDMQSDPGRLGPSQPELKLVERIQELNHRE